MKPVIIAHESIVVSTQPTDSLIPLQFPDYELYDELVAEFDEYTNVLLGRDKSPVYSPYLELMEVATAYHSRAREVEMNIYRMEVDGTVRRGDPLYKFRTGQLNSFIEMARKCIDLGSRRLTQETILTEMRKE